MAILEGGGGRRWAGFVLELQKVLETFQTSFGDGQIARPSREPLGGYSLFGQKGNPSGLRCRWCMRVLAGEAVKMSYVEVLVGLRQYMMDSTSLRKGYG